ncbi:MAG: hypothetical protein AB1689_21670 [Thermodesulfobacteriota bacterium]
MMEATSERAAERSRKGAAGVLRRVFGGVKPGVRYRLWDGSEGEVGEPDGAFTLVIRDRDAFRRAFGSNNTRVMAEAFIDNQIDVDGDLFEALRVANQLEDLELGLFDKLGIYLDLRRV